MLLTVPSDRGKGTSSAQDEHTALIDVEDLSLTVGTRAVLRQVNLWVPANGITTVVGPSGSGKSSLLRVLNRMWDHVPRVRIEGRVRFSGQDLYARGVDVRAVRTHIGMVFQRPTPFPRSIYDNIALTLRAHGIRQGISDQVESVLSASGLWDEVKDRLLASALTLSGGQQQRLSIARALALNPTVLLMDEPQSALDPRSREQITQLMLTLKRHTTIVLVTHHLDEAKRLSDRLGVMVGGAMEVFGPAREIFQSESVARLASASLEFSQ